MPEKTDNFDPEIAAIGDVYAALRDLQQDSQARVLDYVARKLGITQLQGAAPLRSAFAEEKPLGASGSPRVDDDAKSDDFARKNDKEEDQDDSLEGISAVARKWMRRSTLKADQLSRLFSLGIEEIDLVAKSIPGESKKERMRNILLLTGIAAYLGSGAARFKHDKVKEACLHYDAFDNTNFAKYLRDFNSEVSGSKDSDYTLTARGLSSATDLIREMVK